MAGVNKIGEKYCFHCRTSVEIFHFVNKCLRPAIGEKAVAYHMKSSHRSEFGFYCKLCKAVPEPFQHLADLIVDNANAQFFYSNQFTLFDHFLTFHGLLDLRNAVNSFIGRVGLPEIPNWKKVSRTNYRSRPSAADTANAKAVSSRLDTAPPPPKKPYIPEKPKTLQPHIGVEQKLYVERHVEVPPNKTLHQVLHWDYANFDKLLAKPNDDANDLKRMMVILPRGIEYSFESFEFLPENHFNAKFYFYLQDQAAWKKWMDSFSRISCQSWCKSDNKTNNYAPGRFQCVTPNTEYGNCPASMAVEFIVPPKQIGDGKQVNIIVRLNAVHNHPIHVQNSFTQQRIESEKLLPLFFSYFLQGKSAKSAYLHHSAESSLPLPRLEVAYFWHFAFSHERNFILDILLQEELGLMTSRRFTQHCGKGKIKLSPEEQRKSDSLEEELGEITKIKFSSENSGSSTVLQTCQVCQKLVKFPAMRYHAFSHFEKPLYECPLCNFSEYKSIFGTRRHIATAHQDRPGTKPIDNSLKYQKELECLLKLCFPQKTASREKEISDWRSIWSKGLIEPCSICNAAVRLPQVDAHVLHHLGRPNFQCPACPFSSHNSFRVVEAHIASNHPNEKSLKFVNGQLGQEKSIEALKKHCFPRLEKRDSASTNSAVKEDEEGVQDNVSGHGLKIRDTCQLCHEPVNIGTLRRHVLFHLGLNLFECPECGWETQDCHTLMRSHMTSKHPDSEQLPLNFSADYADDIRDMKRRCFPQRFGPQAPYARTGTHGRAAVLESCTICNKEINVNTSAVYHTVLHFGKDLAQCPLCDFSSKFSNYTVKRHMAAKHPESDAQPINEYHEHQLELQQLKAQCFPLNFENATEGVDPAAVLSCNKCGKEVAAKHARRHASSHLRNWLIRCPICAFKTRSSVADVKAHMKREHNEETMQPIDHRTKFKKRIDAIERECFPEL